MAWAKFAEEVGIPPTYTVATESGGFHFYFKVPKSVNKLTFKPTKEIFKGVDVVYNGYVRCPPTKGFTVIHGSTAEIAEAPISLLRQVLSRPIDVTDLVGDLVDVPPEQLLDGIHPPFTQLQLDRLRGQINWIQLNVGLSYHQWYRGLVALKAGITDEIALEEFALLWTRNKNWAEGDDEKAMEILKSTDRFGGIGPGTVFEVIKEVCDDQGDEVPIELLNQKDVIEKSGVPISISKTGMPVVQPNESNICSIINCIPRFKKEQLYYDTRMDSYILDNKQVDDDYITNILTPILQDARKGLGFWNFRRAAVSSAVSVLMDARRIDPHVEWLNSLKWDGVPRIDRFFPRYAMTDDNPYTRTLGRNLWIALAARGLDPGCKMDNIIIIEGREGIRKSSLVEAIGGSYFLSLSKDENLNSTEALRSMHQSIIVEIPELVNMVNREGEGIKAILATNTDSIRNLYAKKGFKRRRGFIFIGTSNTGEYLIGSMGVRRYWPVKIADTVDGVDVTKIKVDRAQLFAEGVHRYLQGESYWEVPKEEWLNQIEMRKIKDPLAQVIEEILLDGAASGVQPAYKLEDIYQVLNQRDLLKGGLNRRTSERLVAVLKAIKAEKIMTTERHIRVTRWTVKTQTVDSLLSELV